MAYVSDETGRWEVYVTSFPDGRVTHGSALSFSAPALVLDGEPRDVLIRSDHVPPGRDGFLTIRRVRDEEEDAEEPRRGIHVVENWLRAFGE